MSQLYGIRCRRSRQTKIHEKRDAEQGSSNKANPKLDELPAQYPSKVNAVATEEVIASLCANIHFENSDDDTDDDRLVMHVHSINESGDMSDDQRTGSS